MRCFMLSVVIFILLSCDKKEKTLNHTSDFDFLIGQWERTNTPEGVVTLENWAIVSPFEYRGHGYTLEKKDTTFQEWMRLQKTDSLWELEITGPNENPVIFKIIDFNTNSFKAENPKNEFPKQIEYSYFDDTLTANISSDEMKIPFIFWRVQE